MCEQRTGLDAACWGGNLTIGAKMRGVAGAIIEGPARDIDESRQLDFPVFARSITGRTARGRIVEVATGEPILVGDVTVHPGDYVIADASSVVFVAQADIERVVEAAELIVQREIADGAGAPRRQTRQRGHGRQLRAHVEKVVMTLSDIPTPALVVDVSALERNIRQMADFFQSRACKLRPHFKAHKTPEIARRQLAAGSCTGLTCATVFEAEIAVPLSSDILIANEMVGADACRRVAALAKRVTITVAIDSPAGLDAISAAARESGATVGALVDVNVGQNRCGVAPGAEAVSLARRITHAPGVELRGLMGYEGHAVGIAGRAEREFVVRGAMQQLVSTAAMFAAAGLPAHIVSAGGTGSYDISSTVEGITEIQAGSYALMDTDYARLGLPFEHALFVLGTVISRPVQERCVADCGHKSCTKDHGNPSVKDIPGATVTTLNDEHATIAVPSTCALNVGDRIQLLPSHIDPTMNLHDVVYALDGDNVIGVWPIAARGYAARQSVS